VVYIPQTAAFPRPNRGHLCSVSASLLLSDHGSSPLQSLCAKFQTPLAYVPSDVWTRSRNAQSLEESSIRLEARDVPLDVVSRTTRPLCFQPSILDVDLFPGYGRRASVSSCIPWLCWYSACSDFVVAYCDGILYGFIFFEIRNGQGGRC
jgi:hypothetical protein